MALIAFMAFIGAAIAFMSAIAFEIFLAVLNTVIGAIGTTRRGSGSYSDTLHDLSFLIACFQNVALISLGPAH